VALQTHWTFPVARRLWNFAFRLSASVWNWSIMLGVMRNMK